MSGGYFAEAGVFLIRVLFGFYILMVMLRFLLQTVRADFYNPLSQFIVKITTPALNPLRRIIPGVAGVDMAAVVLLFLLQIIELLLIALLTGSKLHAGVLIIISFTELFETLLYVYIVAIIVQAVMSWIQPGAYNPVTTLIHQITEPLLRPARRLLPPVSGLDLSPLVVLILLNLVLLAVPHIGRSLLSLL